MRAAQKFGEHEQASTRLNFATKSSKGKILRAVKNFNGPFITPYKRPCAQSFLLCDPFFLLNSNSSVISIANNNFIFLAWNYREAAGCLERHWLFRGRAAIFTFVYETIWEIFLHSFLSEVTFCLWA